TRARASFCSISAVTPSPSRAGASVRAATGSSPAAARDSARLPVRDLPAAKRAGGHRGSASPRAALAVYRRRGASRLVARGEHQQQCVQLLTLLGVERREELVLEALGEGAELRERALAVGCDADDLTAAVVRVALALPE